MTDEKKNLTPDEADEIREETGTVGKIPGEQPRPSSGGGGSDDGDSTAVGDTPTNGGGDGVTSGTTGGDLGGAAIGDTGTNGGGE